MDNIYTLILSLGKQVMRGIVFVFLLIVGIWLYFGPLAFLKYTDTYRETRNLGTILYSHGEPGVIYYFVHWNSTAQIGVNPFCCTIHDTLASEDRLYKYTYATNSSKFVSVFERDRPEKAQSNRETSANIISIVRDGKIIYSESVEYPQRKYSEITLATGTREPIFIELPKNLTIKQVKKLNGDNYFACVYKNNSHKFSKGIFLNRNGKINKELEDACQLSPLLERDSFVLVAKKKDNVDLAQQTTYYKIDNNGRINETIPTLDEYPIVAPDGHYWAGPIVEKGDLTAGILPTSLAIYHGDVLNNSPEKRTINLSQEYLDSIPSQPHFPTKKEAYIQYTKKKLLGKDN